MFLCRRHKFALARYHQLIAMKKWKSVRTSVPPNPDVWSGSIIASIRSGDYGLSPTMDGYMTFDHDVRVLLSNTRCVRTLPTSDAAANNTKTPSRIIG